MSLKNKVLRIKNLRLHHDLELFSRIFESKPVQSPSNENRVMKAQTCSQCKHFSGG